MYIGNVMLLALNLPLIGLWVRLLKVPYQYLAVTVAIICTIGAYSVKNSVFDVGAMVVFGIIGYLMRKGGFPGGAPASGHASRTDAGTVRSTGAHHVRRRPYHLHPAKPISAGPVCWSPPSSCFHRWSVGFGEDAESTMDWI